MTLWESAAASRPQFGDQWLQLDDLMARLQDIPESPGMDIFETDRYMVLAADRSTAPGGVYGYGLWASNPRQLSPALFVQPGLAPPGGAPASVSPISTVARALDVQLPRGIVAVPLPPPQPQAGRSKAMDVVPGMTVTIGSKRASLGLRVRPTYAERAVLTAGHAVAPSIRVHPPGAVVRDERGLTVGRVSQVNDLDQVSVGMATADVAVVVMADERTEDETEIGSSVDAVRELDRVCLVSRSKPSWIRGLSPKFGLTPDLGLWGEVAITAEGISQAGDSGAPVLRTDGAVVGQIVAGYGFAYSLIQDAEYILKEANVTIR